MSRRPGGLDMGRLSQALARDGVDPRFWVSHGTVCTVDDDGECDFEDSAAVVVAPDGVWADVLLQPLSIPVTARLSPGVGGRSCSVLFPLRAGDEVLVALADGGAGLPAIVAVLNNDNDRIPLDEGTPVFQNDRLSIFAEDVPVEVRSRSGASLRLETDGTVTMRPGGAGLVNLGDEAGNLTSMDGLVHGTGIDSFTGATYFALGNASAVVRGKK